MRIGLVPGLACLSLMFASAALDGCGGSKGHGGSAGDTVHVEGKISLRGNLPFALLLLEGKDGVIYMIDTSPIAEELKHLSEMHVRVKVLPEVKGDAPALSVAAYELLPLSTGERPIVGIVVATSPDAVAIRAEDGATWWVEGEFKPVLMAYQGAKIWIVGDRQIAVNSDRGDMRTIMVTEYGIIRE
jgi:hypothetical protein